MEKIRKYVYTGATAVAVISVVGYFAIAIITLIDVTALKIMGDPMLGAYEIIERIMLIVVFCSFAYAQTKNAHINMPIVVERIPRSIRCAILTFTCVLSVIIAILLAVAAIMQGNISLRDDTITGMLHIPLYPFFYIEALAMLLFALVLLIDTYFIVLAIFNDRYNAELIKDFGLTIRKPEKEIRQKKGLPVMELEKDISQ